jgi:hypothetical protein
MHPLLIAQFPSDDLGRLAYADLLETGLTSTDLSLVLLSPEAKGKPHFNGHSPETSTSSALGLGAVPMKEAEGSFMYESHVGGGISTSGPDDDVSSVDELDNSQEIAEESLYPASGQSYSEQDEGDRAAANTGFFATTIPQKRHRARLPEAPDSDLILPGLVEVIGEGTLASQLYNMTTFQTWRGFADDLLELGVSDAFVVNVMRSLRAHGSLLSIDFWLPHLSLEEASVWLERLGATRIETVFLGVEA